MVPIAPSNTNPLLKDLYQSLVNQIELVSVFSVESAFATWISGIIVKPIQINSANDLDVSNYHHVSIAAFLMENELIETVNFEPFLIDGLTRVSGRTITLFESEPAPFRQDAIALIGLALGAKRIGGDIKVKVQKWMNTFIDVSDRFSPQWKRIINFSTLTILGNTPDIRDLQELSESQDIQLAFLAKGFEIFSEIDFDIAYKEICRRAIKGNTEPTIAACSLAALNYLSKNSQVLSIKKPTIDQLLQLLNRVSAGLKRWPWEDKPITKTSSSQKWNIQNEYHVQSLVYSVLAPMFADIEDEFYLETVGPLKPRADIGLPSLSLIIEIKFLREKKSFGKIIEEVAADASLYFRKGSVFSKKYSQMIVFLWDNSSRSQHHLEFIRGVSQLNNVCGSVVISRPGNMTLTNRS